MYICTKTCYAENTYYVEGSLRDTIPRGADAYWGPLNGAEKVSIEETLDKAKLTDKKWLTAQLKEKGIRVDYRWEVPKLAAIYKATVKGVATVKGSKEA